MICSQDVELLYNRYTPSLRPVRPQVANIDRLFCQLFWCLFLQFFCLSFGSSNANGVLKDFKTGEAEVKAKYYANIISVRTLK